MKTKMIRLFLLAAVVASALGCQGEQGPAGPQGAPGAGKIVSTVNCSGYISGVSGTAGTVLNGLLVEYQAVITSSGDVYATAKVADEFNQIAGTAFYGASEVGASTAKVSILADYHSSGDDATWEISLNRTTLVTSAKYTDSSLGGQSPVNMTFLSSNCDYASW